MCVSWSRQPFGKEVRRVTRKKKSNLSKMCDHKSDSGESDSDSSVQSVHSNDSQLSFEFTNENCQKRVDEFVEVTQTDDALAQYFLQDRKWNVARSINDYFREMRKKEAKKRDFVVFAKKDSSSEDADDEEEISTESSKRKKKSKASTSKASAGSNSTAGQVPSGEDSTASTSETTAGEPKLFRHITWNIDGLNEKNIQLRTEAVCSTVIKEKASFVFLQEVVQETESIIRAKLGDKFHIFSGNNLGYAQYYTLTLVAKVTFIKVISNEILEYKQSLMTRNLIKTMVSINDAKICLLNTHLESTKDGEALRIQQLSFMLRHFKEISPDVTILAGGDLNLRDKELAGIGGLPPGVCDAWIATGRRTEAEFTWDMMRNDNLPYYVPGSKSNFKPRLRFDRMFVRKTFPVKIELVHFGLIGIERLLPNVCFPSDHWGVITSYQIFGK